MDDNPYQSPTSAPEPEKPLAKPPSRYWTAGKKFLKVLVFLPVLLTLWWIILVLLKERSFTSGLNALEIAGIIVVLAGLIFLIVRQLR